MYNVSLKSELLSQVYESTFNLRYPKNVPVFLLIRQSDASSIRPFLGHAVVLTPRFKEAFLS